MTPLEAALLASAAYDSKPSLGDEDSAARVVITGNAVAFPGTNNLACWLADLDAKARYIQGLGWVHCGFADAMDEIKAGILSLQDIDTFIGHSEGAALAILAAAYRCLAGCSPKAVYAFEPPRVAACGTLGKLLSKHGVELRLYRNGNDVVPLIPRILYAWQHPASLIAIGKPALPVPNVVDHFMDNVISSLHDDLRNNHGQQP